jgi:large subunit ribosomal protein L5e
MAFVKVQKNNTYYKRFQVKFRRRRQGKTDYYQRKRLTTQRKNKYNTPKWRFVVRRTNQRIICQVVWSTISNDKIKTSADSFELRRFGLTAGLTNYAAAYATGLLCARRLLSVLDKENNDRYKALGSDGKSEMSKTFNFVTEATGEYINTQELAEKKSVQRPFTCFLDLGLVRATSGNRVFAALKGAVDGGLHIPHSDKIFPKAKAATDAKGKPVKDAKAAAGNPLRDRIFGVHVQNYIEKLRKNPLPEGENNQQCKLVEKNIADAKVKTLEELYKKVHAAIRANPARVKKAPRVVKHSSDDKNPNLRNGGLKTYRKDVALTRDQRRKRVQQKIAKFLNERKK